MKDNDLQAASTKSWHSRQQIPSSQCFQAGFSLLGLLSGSLCDRWYSTVHNGIRSLAK